MKILVIGNGFDLDHNLPTGYGEFIKFCDNILCLKEVKKIYLKNLTDTQKPYFDKLSENKALLDNFYLLLKNNCLYEYFSSLSVTNKWIDLEAEILSILTELDQFDEYVLTSYEIPTKKAYMRPGFEKLKGIFPHHFDFVTNELPTTFRNNIFDWLNKISIALEMYISNFVDNTPIEYYSPDITDFCADRILSFNYSNTYEKIYSPKTNYNVCNYIHGKAVNEIENNNSNIVLGITDPLIEHDKRSINSKFEKFFQRIIKGTNSEYKKWLNENKDIEVAFFGHSLSPSDGDIIQELIIKSDKITIFYYDLKMKQEIMMHLIEIIGKEKLTQYVHSYAPKIEFKQQRNHLSITNTGTNISQDIARLRCLYHNKSDKVTTVIDRIKEKIDSEDINYFQSQKLVIELYFELISHNINITDSQNLLKITQQLKFIVYNSNLVEYDVNDYKLPQNITMNKELEFQELINIINDDNNERFFNTRNTTYLRNY